MGFYQDLWYLFIFLGFKYLYTFAALYVFASNRTIYSVLALIVSFIGGACLSISIGADFIGFLLLVVYVGAVLVFFLFVTMMINLGFSSSAFSPAKIFIIFFVSFFYFSFMEFSFEVSYIPINYPKDFYFFFYYCPSIRVIGYIMYNYYWVSFILCGFVLFIAMLGAIVLLVAPVGSDVSWDLDLGFGSMEDNIYTEEVEPSEYDSRYIQDTAKQIETKDYESVKLAQVKIYL